MPKISIIFSLAVLLAACSTSQLNQKKFSYQNLYNKKYKQGTGGIINLTIDGGETYGGQVTPDGKYLFFTSNRFGNNDIFFRALDDVDVIPLVRSVTNQKEPAISPDGSQLAYIEDELDPDGDLVVTELDNLEDIVENYKESGEITEEAEIAGKRVFLTNDEEQRLRSRESNPSWSHDGEWLAFASDRQGVQGSRFGPGLGARQNIWIIQPEDKKSARQVTTRGGVMPSFSRDNQFIIYISYENEWQNGNVFEVELSTGKTRQLTWGRHLDLNPSYTLDGKSFIVTRISEDTNEDGHIDRKDNGQILQFDRPGQWVEDPQEMNQITRKITSKKTVLTHANHNIFDTRTSHFLGGSILFAINENENINIGLIPSSGIIPRKSTIQKQFEFASKIKPGKKRSRIVEENYLLALDKIDHFYGDSPLHIIYGPQKDFLKLEYLNSIGQPMRAYGQKRKIVRKSKNNDFYRVLRDLENISQKKTNKKMLVKTKDRQLYLETIIKAPYKYLKNQRPDSKETIKKQYLKENKPGLFEQNTSIDTTTIDSITGGLARVETWHRYEPTANEQAEINRRFDFQSRQYKTIVNVLRLLLARDYVKQGKIAQAEITYQQIMRSQPDFYQLGLVFQELGAAKLELDLPPEFRFVLNPGGVNYTLKSTDQISGSMSLKERLRAALRRARQKKAAKEEGENSEADESLNNESVDQAELRAAWRKQITPEHQKSVRRKLYNFFLRRYKSRQARLVEKFYQRNLDKPEKEVIYLAKLAEAEYLIDINKVDGARKALAVARPLLPADSYWQFLATKINAEIDETEGRTGQAFAGFLQALESYKTSYAYPGIKKLTLRTLAYFEDRAESARQRNQVDQALDHYHSLLKIQLDLDAKGFETELLEKQSQKNIFNMNQLVLGTLKRVFSSQSQTYQLKTGPIDRALQFYDSHINQARAQLNNAFIFGRGSLLTNFAIRVHQLQSQSAEITRGQKETAFQRFKKAERDFRWSFFANRFFADSYIMLGWMYQFIDERRDDVLVNEGNQSDAEAFSSLYDQYFPDYLFEENIRIYQRSITLLSDKVSKSVIVSFYLNIANNYFLLGNYNKAAENYQYVKDNLGSAFQFSGKKQEANFYFHFGKAQYFAGKNKNALKNLQQSFKLYKDLASLAPGPEQKANQARREKLYRYLAIVTDLLGQKHLAKDYYQQIVNEQDMVGVKNDRSLLNLELGRLHADLDENELALDKLFEAENLLQEEKEVLAPVYPIKIKMGRLTFKLPFYSLSDEEVLIGENRILFSLPTIKRYQYLYSLKARIFRNQNNMQLAARSLEKLLQKAGEDDTSHGLETRLSAYMRLGGVYFAESDLANARAAFLEARELAEKAENLAVYKKIAKNLMAIACFEIEQVPTGIDEKRNFVKNQLELLQGFVENYRQKRLEAEKKTGRELAEGSSAKKQFDFLLSKELYEISVFEPVLKSYQAELDSLALKPVKQNISDYISRHQKIYRENKSIINSYSMPVADPEKADKTASLTATEATRKSQLIVELNKSKLWQNLLITGSGSKYKEPGSLQLISRIKEKAEEFESKYLQLVSSFRLFENYNILGSEDKDRHLEAAVNILEQNAYLRSRNPGLADEIVLNQTKSLIAKKEFQAALLQNNQYRQLRAFQPLLKRFDYSASTTGSQKRLIELLREKKQLDRSELLLQRSIEQKRLNRAAQEVILEDKKQVQEIQKRYKELRKELLSSEYSKLARLILNEPLSGNELKKLELKYLYMIQDTAGFHFFTNAPGELVHKFFLIGDKDVSQVLTLLRQNPQYVFSLNNKKKKPLKENEDETRGSPGANHEWLQWLASLDIDLVIPDGLFNNFPYALVFSNQTMVDYTLTSSYFFKDNRRIDRRGILQILTSKPGFNIFASSEVKYEAPVLQKAVNSLNEWNNNSIEFNVIDYEAQLYRAGEITDQSAIPLVNIMANESLPALGIISYKSLNSISDKEKLLFMGGANLLLAARGASQVVHTLKERTESRKYIADFLHAKNGTSHYWRYNGNPALKQFYDFAIKTKKEEKEIKSQREIIRSLAKDEVSFHLTRARNLEEEGRIDSALAAMNGAIHVRFSEDTLYQSLNQFMADSSDKKITSDFRTPFYLFNLRTRLLYLNNQSTRAEKEISDYLQYIRNSPGKIGRSRIIRKVWVGAKQQQLLYGDRQKAISELTASHEDYGIRKQSWPGLIENYYLSALKTGDLQLIENSLPDVFEKRLDALPDSYSGRVQFFYEKSKIKGVWRKFLYQSLDFNRVYRFSDNELNNASQQKQKEWFLANNWAESYILRRYFKEFSTRSVNTEFSGFFKKPNIDSFGVLAEDRKMSLIDLNLARAHLYLANSDLASARVQFNNMLSQTGYSENYYYYYDYMIFALVHQVFQRKQSIIETRNTLDFLAAFSNKMLSVTKNKQRKWLFQLLARGSSILENPTEIINQYENLSKENMASLLRTLYYRLFYLAATFKPTAFAQVKFRYQYTYRYDNTVKKYLNLVTKLAEAEKPDIKNKTAFNFAFEYYREAGRPALALAAYIDYDRNISIPEDLELSYPVHGFLESFNGQAYYWNVTGSVTLQPIKDLSETEIRPRLAAKSNLVIYLPAKPGKLSFADLRHEGSPVFITQLRPLKQGPLRGLSWQKKTEQGQVNALMNIYLGKPSKKSAAIAVIDSDKKAASSILIWSKQSSLADFASRDRKASALNLVFTEARALGIYYAFLQLYLVEITNNQKQSPIESYFKAKDKLRAKYPEPSDYNSVLMIGT